MLRIGLTGGIGAGKSEVARRLATHGALVIDADRLAREVVAPGTDGLRAVADAFGPGVLAADGALDRAALAATVFSDEPARRRLEAIIHPRVRARTAALAAAAPPDTVVVNDVPLLVEVGLAPSYHLVLVVTAAATTRLARLVADPDRGLTEAQAQARIQAQASDSTRAAAADVLLTNDGTRADLHAAVDRLWRERLVPYEANLRHGRPAPRSPRPVLVAPDPTWQRQAERLVARVHHALPDRPGRAGNQPGFSGRVLRVDHVGSTAVPGLAAKDVLDLQVVIAGPPADPGATGGSDPGSADLGGADPGGADLGGADLGGTGGLVAALAGAGLVRMPGQWHDQGRDGHPYPKIVMCNADPERAVNLHLRAAASPSWRDALLLRDWLRANPPAAAEYEAEKRALAARPHESIDAYASAKTPWLRGALARADAWAAATGWRPDAEAGQGA